MTYDHDGSRANILITLYKEVCKLFWVGQSLHQYRARVFSPRIGIGYYTLAHVLNDGTKPLLAVLKVLVHTLAGLLQAQVELGDRIRLASLYTDRGYWVHRFQACLFVVCHRR